MPFLSISGDRELAEAMTRKLRLAAEQDRVSRAGELHISGHHDQWLNALNPKAQKHLPLPCYKSPELLTKVEAAKPGWHRLRDGDAALPTNVRDQLRSISGYEREQIGHSNVGASEKKRIADVLFEMNHFGLYHLKVFENSSTPGFYIAYSDKHRIGLAWDNSKISKKKQNLFFEAMVDGRKQRLDMPSSDLASASKKYEDPIPNGEKDNYDYQPPQEGDIYFGEDMETFSGSFLQKALGENAA